MNVSVIFLSWLYMTIIGTITKGKRMDSIVKTYLDIFVFIIFAIFAIQLISVSVADRAAESYLETAADRISCSHFSDDVIASCKSDAKNRFSEATGVEWPLTVVVNQRGTSGIKYGYAELTYRIKVPLFGINKNYTIHTDIR